MDRFITYQFEPHQEKILKRYSDFIFWVKDDEAIAEIENSKYFWTASEIWDTISVMFSLNYDETKLAIKRWLEEHYELGGLNPLPHQLLHKERWSNI